jgi:hypothetical protein
MSAHVGLMMWSSAGRRRFIDLKMSYLNMSVPGSVKPALGDSQTRNTYDMLYVVTY